MSKVVSDAIAVHEEGYRLGYRAALKDVADFDVSGGDPLTDEERYILAQAAEVLELRLDAKG